MVRSPLQSQSFLGSHRVQFWALSYFCYIITIPHHLSSQAYVSSQMIASFTEKSMMHKIVGLYKMILNNYHLGQILGNYTLMLRNVIILE